LCNLSSRTSLRLYGTVSPRAMRDFKSVSRKANDECTGG
jgi:hypothetical protein